MPIDPEMSGAARRSGFAAKWRALALLAAAGPLAGGCAATSFAPPQVNASKAMTSASGQKCVEEATPHFDLQANRNIEGATALTDNFILAYRCAQREAANGRSYFEVPSMLALAVAAVGPTFGMGENGAIGFASGSAVLGRGNGYFAPKEKAGMIDGAIDALLCIKTVSVGVEFFDTNSTADAVVNRALNDSIDSAEAHLAQLTRHRDVLAVRAAQSTEAVRLAQAAPPDSALRLQIDSQTTVERENLDLLQQTENDITRDRQQISALRATLSRLQPNPSFLFIQRVTPSGTIQIDVQRQYFEMVSAALFSVERVLAGRLTNAGSFDPAGITAELEKLTKKEEDVEPKKDAAADAVRANALTNSVTPAQQQNLIDLDLALLQPRLQKCVVRAKMA